MITQESGSINVFSMVRGAYANFIAYGTSKWGLERIHLDAGRGSPLFEHLSQLRRTRLLTSKLTGYNGNQHESVTDVFVSLASEQANGMSGKMLSFSGWSLRLNNHPGEVLIDL